MSIWERIVPRVVLGKDPWNEKASYLRFINAMDFTGRAVIIAPAVTLAVFVHWTVLVGWISGFFAVIWLQVCDERRAEADAIASKETEK